MEKKLNLKTIKLPVKTKNNPDPWDNRPSMTFTEAQLPEIKEWQVGDEYMLCIKAKMTGSRELEYGDDKGKIGADFKMVQVGVMSTEKKK